MKVNYQFAFATIISFLVFFSIHNSFACSTFKLQKGGHLLYGHNLNQGDLGVPGMIYINKRGIFKKGHTWDEISEINPKNVSDLYWISRFGSITFNAFGRDFPDGGMNEAGLYIWEMNEMADYPKNENLPKLDQMNWMQFILDNYSTLDEAIQCASEVEIHGWGWHYFIGDASGDCAALAFIDGEVVVNREAEMPVPGLFNTPYDREMEFLKYYKGFGGNYEPDLNDPNVPRFVKTAVLLRDYKPYMDPVDYGMHMLDQLQVDDVPEWSILFDVINQEVHFKTRINPEIKNFSMPQIDFSNDDPVLILNMDVEPGGDVSALFQPYSNDANKAFISDLVVPILPEEFFTQGGLTIEKAIDRIVYHADPAGLVENQYFFGSWKNETEGDEEEEIKIVLTSTNEYVSGQVFNSQSTEEGIPIEHVNMIGNKLRFTFKTKGNSLMEIQAIINEDEMQMSLFGIEEYYGDYVLFR